MTRGQIVFISRSVRKGAVFNKSPYPFGASGVLVVELAGRDHRCPAQPMRGDKEMPLLLTVLALLLFWIALGGWSAVR